MPRHENDGQRTSPRLQRLLQVRAADSGEPQVQHQAAAHLGRVAVQERLGGGKHFALQTLAAHEPRHEVEDRHVIVNNKDSDVFRHGLVVIHRGVS